MNSTSNKDQSEIIFGYHAAWAVLKDPDAPQKVNKIFLQKGLHSEKIARIIEAARSQHLVIQDAPKSKLDDMTQAGNHQGIVLTTTDRKSVV